MTDGDLLPPMVADEIGLCHLRRGTIVARTVFEPVFAFKAGRLVQASLKARTECLIAGRLLREPATGGALASGDPAFDLACALAHIRNFAQTEEADSSLLVDLEDAPDRLFGAFVNHLREELELGWVEPGQIVVALPVRREASRSIDMAARLRDLGLRLGLADFGAAGAASALVENLRPELVGFDAGWVRRAAAFDPARRLLGSLVGLLRDKAITVMLEGIADEAELEVARQAGIDLVCGPFVAPSFPAGVAECHRPGAGNHLPASGADSGAEVVRLRG